MIEKLELINQSGLKSLLKERLEKPSKYEKTPLIIWRADIRDGITQPVLSELFEQEHDPFGWYKIVSIRRRPQTYREAVSEMLSSPFVDLNNNQPYEPVRTGSDCRDERRNDLLVIDPADDHDPASMADYQTLLNDRQWRGVCLTPGVPVVAFMNCCEDWFERPELFPVAEQYVFQPDFEEWAKWAREKAGVPEVVIDFIRGDGREEGIAYRWYNQFRQIGGDSGCRYPANWIRKSTVKVPWPMILGTAAPKFAKAVPHANRDQLDKKFGKRIPADILDSLSQYLTAHA